MAGIEQFWQLFEAAAGNPARRVFGVAHPAQRGEHVFSIDRHRAGSADGLPVGSDVAGVGVTEEIQRGDAQAGLRGGFGHHAG
ncbi:hypothetical protein ACU4GD_09650 [Cupriavidus basilensis]